MTDQPDNHPPPNLPEQTQPQPEPRAVVRRVPSAIVDNYDEYEDDYEEGGRCAGCAWGVAGMLGCITIPLAALVLLVFLGINTVSGIFDGITSIFSPSQRVYKVMSAPMVLESVQGMGRLTSARYNYSTVITMVGESRIPILDRDDLTMVVVGYVDAGIDLTALTEADISIAGDTLTIQLPPPELHNCVLNEFESYVVSRETGLFVSAAPEVDAQVRQYAILQFQYAALEDGIFDEANFQAQTVIEPFISMMPLDEDITEIQVLTQPGDLDAPCPDTTRSQEAPELQVTPVTGDTAGD
jgi:hypothetical protein